MAIRRPRSITGGRGSARARHRRSERLPQSPRRHGRISPADVIERTRANTKTEPLCRTDCQAQAVELQIILPIYHDL